MEVPTYSNEALKETIPIADLDDIKLLSSILRKEISRYKPAEYTVIITALTKRLIELSEAIKTSR